MLEVRFHGRGGQGAVTAAELLAQAAIAENRHAQGFPSFGAERRGAPVAAYLRVSDSAICLREKINEPDVVVILDPSLVKSVDVFQGLRDGGTIILNTPSRDACGLEVFHHRYRLAVVDANRIAVDTLGIPIGNTAMIGALLRATGVVRQESLRDPVSHRFGRLAGKNLQAIRRAYKQTAIIAAGDGVQADKNRGRETVHGPELDALHAYVDLSVGCDITRPGSTDGFFTGNWRTSGKPVTVLSQCTKCGLCWILCPDMAYQPNSLGYFDLDDRYCKGCGTCVEQCPKGAISLQGEES